MPTISLLTDSPTTLSPPLWRRFTGSYMQVLPDDRDSYHSIHGEGSFTMTGLEYVIDVAQAGRHTLYLRWSGGDDRGAGDSLYVVMREYATDHIVPGEDTLKPTLVAIDAVPGQYAGCCYDSSTHSCNCLAAEPAEADCASWQTTERAHGWAMCPKGAGQMDAVNDPLWCAPRLAEQPRSTAPTPPHHNPTPTPQLAHSHRPSASGTCSRAKKIPLRSTSMWSHGMRHAKPRAWARTTRAPRQHPATPWLPRLP